MKFLDFFKFKGANAVVGAISDSDLDLLAVMCQLCEPKILKEGFITNTYAYYVPQEETDLDSVKEIFARNGIPVHEHMSRISGGMVKQKVLRIDYREVKDKDKLKQEMKKIEQRQINLYKKENWEKMSALRGKIQELNLNQKQK